jgi:hypothetical protein
MLTRCSRQVLAATDFAVVEECSCGSIHLTIGAITLRLTTDALPLLASVVGDAARTLVLTKVCRSSQLQSESVS